MPTGHVVRPERKSRDKVYRLRRKECLERLDGYCESLMKVLSRMDTLEKRVKKLHGEIQQEKVMIHTMFDPDGIRAATRLDWDG